MPRPNRLLISNGFYHVFTRGNNKQPLFLDQEDRMQWLNLMREAKKVYGCKIFAYCLMSNHIHRGLETVNPNLDKFMEQLKRFYTRYFNRKYNKLGHLFEGRYKAKLVQKDKYLLALVRYIHLNPVKANMVPDPADYVWSSHADYLGGRVDSFVDFGEVLTMFAADRGSARLRYLDFLNAPIPKKEWYKFDSARNGVLGIRALQKEAATF